MGARNTPPEIIETWENAVQEVLKNPDYRQIYSGAMLLADLHAAIRVRDFIDTFASETETFLRESGVIN